MDEMDYISDGGFDLDEPEFTDPTAEIWDMEPHSDDYDADSLADPEYDEGVDESAGDEDEIAHVGPVPTGSDSDDASSPLVSYDETQVTVSPPVPNADSSGDSVPAMAPSSEPTDDNGLVDLPGSADGASDPAPKTGDISDDRTEVGPAAQGPQVTTGSGEAPTVCDHNNGMGSDGNPSGADDASEDIATDGSEAATDTAGLTGDGGTPALAEQEDFDIPTRDSEAPSGHFDSPASQAESAATPGELEDVFPTDLVGKLPDIGSSPMTPYGDGGDAVSGEFTDVTPAASFATDVPLQEMGGEAATPTADLGANYAYQRSPAADGVVAAALGLAAGGAGGVAVSALSARRRHRGRTGDADGRTTVRGE